MGLVMFFARCGDEDLRPLTFRFDVRDVDDNQPRFSVNAWELTVNEHSPRATTIELPVAIDRDGPQFSNVSYDLNVSSPAVPFAVRKRGQRSVLEVVGDLDHERHAVYCLNLSARNAWEHLRSVHLGGAEGDARRPQRPLAAVRAPDVHGERAGERGVRVSRCGGGRHRS